MNAGGYQYVIEATTPEGEVEFSENYTGASLFCGVVKDMVQDYANQTGCTPQDVAVTSVWRVETE